MVPIKGFDKIQASEDFERLPVDGYVIRITAIKDEAEKQYLTITYDIAEGKYAGYYKKSAPEYLFTHQFRRSYKETALRMFKGFINAVESSNAGYKWDWNESGLVGKILGVVLGEEEYENNRGEIKTGLYVAQIKTADNIRNGNYTIPEIKRLPEDKPNEIPSGFTPLTDDSLPF